MKEMTKKYRLNKELDLSCSEAILYAANEKYNLELNKSSFKMMAPFSGGMYDGDTCGILTASISVLGIILAKDNSHNSPELKEAVLEYKEKFESMYHSRKCDRLKELHRKEDTGCDDLIVNASVLLEEIVNKYDGK